ncbi:uncharacterized protein lrrfip1a isoform X4 [Eleginops maclovinus]|uniref:uncharacterized protein lrrfip1a isoform X4 n=1 Tax=Eleginops maclovinus TaxID=56733 RepID=UPI0030805A67
MGTQGAGRKRSTKKDKSTAEDDALNLIAREAEARLAAKRAARAEARDIRMKELERQQKEIFQVQKKYYGLNTKVDDRSDSKWGDIEQWMDSVEMNKNQEDSERYSRSSRIQTLSDDDERMSVGSRSSVRSDLDSVGAYGGGDSSSIKKSKKKKKHKHKDRNGHDDEYSVMSSRSSRQSDESRVSRSSRLDLTSSRLSDDPRGSRGSRLDLQPTSYASSDLYSYNGLSSARNPGSTFNGYQSSLYEDSGLQRGSSSLSLPVEYSSYRTSGSRVSSRAGSARGSPVDNCGSVASFLRSAAGSSGLHLDDVTIPDFSDVEDRDYLEKGSRAASSMTAATLTSLGGSSSRRGSGETAITVDAETSIREIKEIHELKDQIQDVESKYMQNLKEVKDALVQVEEKYRKAMVSNAQLDNEKNNLMYQVDTLKDSLMELEELLSESRRGFEDKVKECEREKHAHTVLQFQFNEMKETLKQSEELLNDIRQLHIKMEGLNREICDLQETVEWKDKKIGALERQKEYTDAIRVERDELREEVVNLKDILKKHGIVLGPDLSINGEDGVADADSTLSADPASPLAQEAQTPPTEGNSMLGNTEETQLRSSEEEEVDPEQQQEHFEEAKENLLSSDALCDVSGVCTVETSTDTEEQRDATEVDGVEEPGLRKDLNVDIKDQSVTESKDIIICSPELQGIVTSSEESVLETVRPEGKELGGTNNLDSGEPGTNINSVDIRESGNNFLKEQENKQEDVEEHHLRNTESRPEQKVVQPVESLPEESVPAESNTDAPPEPENPEEAENMETEELSGNSQPQGAAAPGKKKKKKRKGKKNRGTQEDRNQQRDGADREKGKTEVKIEPDTKDNELKAEPEVLASGTEEPGMDQVKNEQDGQKDGVEEQEPHKTGRESRRDHVADECDKEQTLEKENVEEAEAATETFSHVTTPAEVGVDHVTEEQNKEQCLGTVKAGELVAPAETHVETLKESRTVPIPKDEQDQKQPLETQRVEEVGSLTNPVPETILSTESPDDLNGECTSCVDNSKSGISTNDCVIQAEAEVVHSEENEVRSIDEMKSEYTPDIPENPETGSHNPINGDMAADESEPTSRAESKDKPSVPPPSTDSVTDTIKSSEPSAGGESPFKVSDGGPEEVTETIKDDEEPEIATEQDKPQEYPSVLLPSHEEAELTADRAEEDFNRGLREPEGLVQTDPLDDQDKETPSFVTNMDAIDTVQSVLETVVRAEPLDNVETAQCEGHVDESSADITPELEINTTETITTPDVPKEAHEHGSTMAEDPEHNNNPNDQQGETQPLHEPMDELPSQPTLQECNEEDGENNEGPSFDFDDMDMEPAEVESLPRNPQQEEVEEGVEVVPDESGSSGVETLSQNSSAQDGTLGNGGQLLEKEEAGLANETGGIVEEAKFPSVGEAGGAPEDINQALSLPVEEGLEAIKQEHVDLPKSAEQVGGSKEPQQGGKDVRKNSKKGKGKGKEECKMS